MVHFHIQAKRHFRYRLEFSGTSSEAVESHDALRDTDDGKGPRNHHRSDIIGGLLLPGEDLTSSGLVNLLQFINLRKIMERK